MDAFEESIIRFIQTEWVPPLSVQRAVDALLGFGPEMWECNPMAEIGLLKSLQ